MTINVLAVASAGGHFTQLLLALEDAEQRMNVSYVTTKLSFVKSGYDAYLIPDFSRDNPLLSFKCYHTIAKIIRDTRPDIVITTGAAPGLIALLAGRAARVRTVWLDSCANYDKLSLSGRIASYLADLTLTQWPHLAKGRVHFRGCVL